MFPVNFFYQFLIYQNTKNYSYLLNTAPDSRFPTPYSLLPTPYSLKKK
ncbi:hypothetical protein [Moorena sp. SIO3I8]|nr:hypothetical protein [Moorena sp. SIO3I8]NEO10529.1 hypothetical protein [Moorena sp. SIO3I8]